VRPIHLVIGRSALSTSAALQELCSRLPLEAPIPQRFERGTERFAFSRQTVTKSFRSVLGRGLLHDAVGQQSRQPFRQYIRWDSLR